MSHYVRRELKELLDLSAHVELVRELAPATRYQRPQNVFVAGFDCRPARALEAVAGQFVDTPAVLEYRVADAVIVDQGIVLTPDGYAVEESLSETTDLDNAVVRVTKDAVELKQTVREPAISGLLLKKRGQTNFGHWLTELLVRFFLHQQVSKQCVPAIVHHPQAAHDYLRTLYRESLQLCADGPVDIVEVGNEPQRCEDLRMVTGLSSHPVQKHPGGFSKWQDFLEWQARNTTRKHPVLREMGRHLRQRVDASCGSDRLFITRAESSLGRQIQNASEIEGFFRGEGFRVLDPAQFSFQQQISLFAGATQVLGVLCAAFANGLFASEQCRFGYLAPVYMNGAFYLDLDSVMGRRDFGLFYCDYVGRPLPWSLRSNIKVPLGEVTQWYRQLPLLE